jgi:short subunit dehydrogenase-like uncharacterized protein
VDVDVSTGVGAVGAGDPAVDVHAATTKPKDNAMAGRNMRQKVPQGALVRNERVVSDHVRLAEVPSHGAGSRIGLLSASMTTTDFDLVLFGATGFTGRPVAEYLVKKRPALRWALAGRSREKLERVRRDLTDLDSAAKDLPLVVGDSLDAASVDAMVRRTRVVCSTVGPYVRYGGPLVAACAERGVHYCDLTGETPFIRAAIDAHHERAIATGARIVPCCGFDSIPSDLGVCMLHDAFVQQGQGLTEAHFRVVKMKGGASGGTVASMLDLFATASDPKVRRALGDPYGLNPAGAPRGKDRGDQNGPRLDPDTGHWTAPFVMAAINTRVVRRSNALLGFPYGEGFRYDEATDTGSGPAGFARAVAMSAGLGVFGATAILPVGRALLSRLLPAPGEGPSREQRESGGFRVAIHAKGSRGDRLTGVVEASRDPGYGATSIMIGESALCLAQDELPARGGVLTPASCMGMVLVERLRKAGMTFRVE